ncbi:hypothetical protein X805_31700 [Sphaerotilus natans subsp. natans DSM 6575]|uniref:Uncharacterized protein n=1 Tax=Sphaerotilus natans subsp. natans DSM 6575 TaxID=1286631 RepID=A0A059KJE2_9BURK|nr:hypothetical protein X805_31700 [Sphaerotilus natans subsp. natans DSM 6575]
MSLCEQCTQVLCVAPFCQPGGQPQQRSMTGSPGAPEEARGTHVRQPPGQPFVVNCHALPRLHHPTVRAHRHQPPQTQDLPVLADPVDRHLRQSPSAIPQQVARGSGCTDAHHILSQRQDRPGDCLLTHPQGICQVCSRGRPSPENLAQRFIMAAHVE